MRYGFLFLLFSFNTVSLAQESIIGPKAIARHINYLATDKMKGREQVPKKMTALPGILLSISEK